MPFSWLQTASPRGGGTTRVRVAIDEVSSRAGLLFRLGFSEAAASQRLRASVAWEYDTPSHGRPEGLSDHAIAKIVADTYARRPG